MLGNSWRDGLTKEEIRAAEQWAGAQKTLGNMAEGLLEEVCKNYKIPPVKVHIPTRHTKDWTVHGRYYIEGHGDVHFIEPYDIFPSETFRATLIMLGLVK